ncbi:uncharacterized protein [Mytilus edulis]|uniref:uncharacterized protein n=1 Tax=Mytilus edulis TaxID=6550 RepID=UPI0039EFD51D
MLFRDVSTDLKMRHYISFFTIFSFWGITGGNLILVDIYKKEHVFSDVLCNDGKLITLNSTRSAFICAKVCALALTCVSFFFNQNGTCQLHNIKVSDTVDCIKHSGTYYYVRKGFIPETTTTAKITTASADRIPDATTTLKITTASVDLIPETTTTPELTTTSVDLIPEMTSTSKITTSVDFIPETTTTSKITTDSVDFIPETTTSKITTDSVELIPETTSTSKITITSVDFIPETTTTSNIKTDSVDFIPETTTSKITDSVDSIPETTTTSIDFLSTETSIPTSQSTSRQVSCDLDWILVGASCYRITPPDTITKQQWKNASEICKDNGGYLATLETAEENQLVKDYVGTLGKKDYFIGGSDLQTEGTFLWEHSGVIVNLHGSGLFYDWMSLNQPDNGNGNQHCMILAGRYGHMWNDVQCTVARAFICEKDAA